MVPQALQNDATRVKMEGLDMHFLGVETYADCLLQSPLLLPVPGEGGKPKVVPPYSLLGQKYGWRDSASEKITAPFSRPEKCC